MLKFLSRVVIVPACLLLVACSNLTVSGKRLSDRDWPTADSFVFDTSSRINTGGRELNGAILSDLLRKGLTAQLHEKNVSVATDAGDLLVYYYLDVEVKSELEDKLKPLRGDAYATGDASIRGSHAMLDAPRARDYAYGDLLIKVLDAGTREPLWQGKAGLAIDIIPDYTDLEVQINTVLNKMFKKFP